MHVFPTLNISHLLSPLLCGPLQIIEYQNMQAEYAAAIELSGSPLASPSTETKQEQNREAELKRECDVLIEPCCLICLNKFIITCCCFFTCSVILGKVSAERDELREEVARLRRITTTLAVTLPPAPAPAGSSASSAAAASPSNRSTASARAAGQPAAGTGRRTAGPAQGATGRAAAVARASTGGEKEKQQAATNVLVIELNAEVTRMAFSLFGLL